MTMELLNPNTMSFMDTMLETLSSEGVVSRGEVAELKRRYGEGFEDDFPPISMFTISPTSTGVAELTASMEAARKCGNKKASGVDVTASAESTRDTLKMMYGGMLASPRTYDSEFIEKFKTSVDEQGVPYSTYGVSDLYTYLERFPKKFQILQDMGVSVTDAHQHPRLLSAIKAGCFVLKESRYGIGIHFSNYATLEVTIGDVIEMLYNRTIDKTLDGLYSYCAYYALQEHRRDEYYGSSEYVETYKHTFINNLVKDEWSRAIIHAIHVLISCYDRCD